MKKYLFGLSVLMVVAAGSLFAAKAPAKAQVGQNMNCSQLSPAEQNFAAQIMDMNNKMTFCSQMTMQQRQQAMQMMGQPDASGNIMNADQAVQQVMASGSNTTSQNSMCSQLTQAEQNFAAQIMDMNNKRMFCSQMGRQQRLKAMQMLGQPDASGNTMNADQAVQQVMSNSSMSAQSTDCTQLSPGEQAFANQLTDMNNKMMFCSQMTMQQRQQAMQMMGQPNASGSAMNADQAVQQVMGPNGMTPQARSRSTGGCPVQ